MTSPRLTLRKYCIRFFGPTLRNCLPLNTRNLQTIYSFQRNYKLFLIGNATCILEVLLFLLLCVTVCVFLWWLGSRVVNVPDSGAEGTGVQIAVATLSSNSLRQTVHTHCASVYQAAKLVAALLRVAGVTAGLAESNGSLPPGLWLTSPAGWLQGTGISSETLRWVIEYGLLLPFFVVYFPQTLISRQSQYKRIATWDDPLPIVMFFCLRPCRELWGNKNGVSYVGVSLIAMPSFLFSLRTWAFSYAYTYGDIDIILFQLIFAAIL